MGAVYRAHHAEFPLPVALKVMSPSLADDPDAQARFRREAEILDGLRHPNVVPFLASGHDRGLAFIAMAYVDGEDLAATLRRRGRLSVAETCAIVDGVAAALDAAHALGVVHRDIKPANVLLAGDVGAPIASRKPLVMDFGVARLATDPTSFTGDASLIGSLPYMAPEQIQNANQVDARADVYALGATAYELVVGRPPFRESSALAMVMAQLRQPPPDPRAFVPGLPPAAASALLTALAKAPADRFASAGALAAALRDATASTTS
jgi:serine/threonine-protein kinase